MSTTSPAQLYATLIGATLVIAGIFGFFFEASFDTGVPGVQSDEVIGLLTVNGWGNIEHLALGILGLAAAGSAARAYCLAVGLFYVVLGIWGFADGNGVLLGLLPLQDFDNGFHLLLGLVGLAAGAASPKASPDRAAAG